MTVKELEERVVALEEHVKQLSSQLAAATAGRTTDWRASVEKFKNDPDILSVLRDAMRLREKERQAVHRKRSTSRRPKA